MIAAFICGCSSGQSEESYADDQFVQDAGKAFSARNSYIDSLGTAPTTADEQRQAPQTELDILSKYTDSKFEDSELQELAISYINALNDQVDACDYFDSNYEEFTDRWETAYDKRCQLLQKLVDDYGMTVDSSAQEDLDALLANATLVNEDETAKSAANSLASKFQENATECYSDYGDFEGYSATIENDTDVSFKTISFNVMVYDEDGTRTETAYAYVDEWNAGETVEVKAYTMEQGTKISASVDYYEAA